MEDGIASGGSNNFKETGSVMGAIRMRRLVLAKMNDLFL